MALPAPLGDTSGKDNAPPGILRALRTAWAGPGGAAARVRDPALVPPCSLTGAAARAPALHLLADEAAEQAGQRAELGEVLHAVHGDVQGLGRQEPQLRIVGVLHACRGWGELSVASQDHWAPARHPAGRGSFPSHRPKTPQAQSGATRPGPRERRAGVKVGLDTEGPPQAVHACLAVCGFGAGREASVLSSASRTPWGWGQAPRTVSASRNPCPQVWSFLPKEQSQ